MSSTRGFQVHHACMGIPRLLPEGLWGIPSVAMIAFFLMDFYTSQDVMFDFIHVYQVSLLPWTLHHLFTYVC